MAYFDSAKNRALWSKELDTLRAERSKREATGFVGSAKKKIGADAQNNPYRIRMTYAQLVREEYEATKGERSGKGRQKAMRDAEAGMERRPEAEV